MKPDIQNTRYLAITALFVLSLFSGKLKAQDSLLVAQFRANLMALENLYGTGNSEFGVGDFFEHNTNVGEILNTGCLFASVECNWKDYHQVLENLPLAKQQHLVQTFYFYEPLIAEELRKEDLPQSLKFLAPAFSAMNQLAVGKNKRAGIWQLTHFQGVLNGLEINRLVDERLKVQLATQAFVAQIKSNLKQFDSSELAVLAYWLGNAKIRNAIRNGKNDNAEVLKTLPNKTNETISLYKALCVFLSQHQFKPVDTEQKLTTLEINRQVHFKQIEQVIDISEAKLAFLNPQYYHQILPGNIKTAALTLPQAKYDLFVMMSDSVYNAYDSALFEVVEQKIEYAPAPSRKYVGEKVKDLEIEGKTKIKYIIQTGDVLGFIAEDYDVRVADLKYWNNIYNERKIQAGKKLDIFVDDDKADYYKSLQAVQTRATAKQVNAKPVGAIPPNARKVEHTVKSGESPYVIAKKYQGVTPEAILAWNGINDARKIQIGQKLIIYLAQ